MNKKKSNKKIRGDERRRFQEAEQNLRRIERKIKPFVEHRPIELYSTAGTWKDTEKLLEAKV